MILSRPGRWFITQPCEQMVGFRNRSVHEHTEVDPGIVWTFVQKEVPQLLEKSETLLEESAYRG